MNTAGMLSFKIYNQEGKNEVLINTPDGFTQSLKMMIINRHSNTRFEIEENKSNDETKPSHHFQLKFKKGLFLNPENFGKSGSMKVSTWRSVTGQDLFITKNLSEKELINMKGLKEKLEAYAQTMKSEVSKLEAAPPAELISVKETLLEKLSKDEIIKDKIPEITKLKELHNRYDKTLANINDYTQAVGGHLGLDASMVESAFDIIKPFLNIGSLQQEIQNISSNFENSIFDIQKKKLNNLYELFANIEDILKEYFKKFIDDQFQVEHLLDGALQKIKLKDIFDFESLKIDEGLMHRLEGKIVKSVDTPDQWDIKFKNNGEEDIFYFTYKGKSNKLVLNSNGYLMVDINLGSMPKRPAESCNVELYYPQVKAFQTDTNPVNPGNNQPSPNEKEVKVKEPFSQAILSLVNYGSTGLSFPLDVEIAKGMQVLSNGNYENEIALRLTNVDKAATIVLDKESRINLSFEVCNEGEIGNSALTDKANYKIANVSMLEVRQDKNTIDKGKKIITTKASQPLAILKKVYKEIIDVNQNYLPDSNYIVGVPEKQVTLASSYKKLYYVDNTSKTWKVIELSDAYTYINSTNLQDTLLLKNTEKQTEKVLYEFNTEKTKLNNRFVEYNLTFLKWPGNEKPKTSKIKALDNDLDMLKNLIIENFIQTLPGKTNWKSSHFKIEKDNQTINHKGWYVLDENCLVTGDYYQAGDIDQMKNVEQEQSFLVLQSQKRDHHFIARYYKQVFAPKFFSKKETQIQEKIRSHFAEVNAKNLHLVRSIKIQADGQKASVNFEKAPIPFDKNIGGLNAIFTLRITEDIKMKPGEYFMINIYPLKTDLLPHLANIKVNISNINQYRDLEQVVQVSLVRYLDTEGRGIRNDDPYSTNESLLIRYPKTKIRSGDYTLTLTKSDGLAIKNGGETLLTIKNKEDIYRQSLPHHSIIMWYGDKNTVPKDWRICDGSNNTPNLSGKFMADIYYIMRVNE